MLIVCPKCGERCEIDFEPEVGQHIICPFCNQKFSYGDPQGQSPKMIMAVCPYCGFGEQIEAQYEGHIGECSQCHSEFTITANAKGIPLRAQSPVSVWSGADKTSVWISGFSQLDPKLLVKLLMRVGMVLGGFFIAAESVEFLFWSLFLMMIATLAPKFGAASNLKRLGRYLMTCAVLAVAVRGGCYGLHQSQIRKDKRTVAAKKTKVDARVQKLSMYYFGHELCEWYPAGTDESKIVIRGENPFACLQGGGAVKKSSVVSGWDGCLFELRAELSRQTKLPGEITHGFAEAKVGQFKNLDLIAKITKTLGKEPNLVSYPLLPGELVNLNAEYNSDERAEDGKPLVSIKVSYSLSSGGLLASQSGRDSDAGYSDHESWCFEIFYNGL